MWYDKGHMVTKGKSTDKKITIPTSLHEIYTPEEVAGSFRIDPRQLKKMRAEGRGPKPLFISPNVVRYRASAVEEYLNAVSMGQDYSWDPGLYCRATSSGRSGENDTRDDSTE